MKKFVLTFLVLISGAAAQASDNTIQINSGSEIECSKLSQIKNGTLNFIRLMVLDGDMTQMEADKERAILFKEYSEYEARCNDLMNN